jgi:ABC-2 type transport system permease protein
MSYKAIYVIVFREFKRFFRQRGRVLVTVLRPLLWLFIVGAGFSGIVDPGSPVTYIQFLLPGVVGMTILFSSIFSTISVVWDREFGFLREMLVAPVSRITIVTGKLLSGTTMSLFQGMALLIVAPFLGITIGMGKLVAMVFLITLVSLSITAFGLFIAARIESLQGFNVIMNFIVLPMFFLSGALYPVETLPVPVNYLAFINPLCYGVDSFKHVLFSEEVLPSGGLLGAEFPLHIDIIMVGVFTVVMIVLSSRSFDRR